jgi:protein-S-isoprenylcysteine O-methyltransferase Ste14
MIVILARLRVALGFIGGVLVFVLAEPSAMSIANGAIVACVGEAIRIWAAGHLRKSQEVTASGPYRWTAHPLYAGSSIMGAGLAIMCASRAAALLIGVYLVVTLTAAIKSEESYLRRTFGDQYGLYKRGVAEQRSRASHQRRRFELSQAFANREYRAVAGLAVVVLLLILKARYTGGSGM